MEKLERIQAILSLCDLQLADEFQQWTHEELRAYAEKAKERARGNPSEMYLAKLLDAHFRFWIENDE